MNNTDDINIVSMNLCADSLRMTATMLLLSARGDNDEERE